MVISRALCRRLVPVCAVLGVMLATSCTGSPSSTPQAVDRMIASLQDTLTKAGVAANTDIVFSSDNGYHMGEYRLTPGKMTAFDTDVNVPLVAAGPGIRAGSVISDPAQNIDLAPTFEALTGAATPATVDGRSLIPLLSGQSDAGWRTASLVLQLRLF